jgi:SAM-dependent methyltransferase
VLTPGLLEQGLRRRAPALLSRARALLRLPGGPADALSPKEEGLAVRAIAALHHGLVGERLLARAETYDEAAHLGAYLLWWWPQSYAKVRAALALEPAALSQVGSGVVSLLEVGAGSGPGAAAVSDHFSLGGLKVEALLLDKSAAALAEAAALLRGTVGTAVDDLEGTGPALPTEEKAGLVLAANVLSELPGGAPERAALLQRLASRLRPGGRLLVLEPALKETGRALLEARDLLLGGEPKLFVHAPCFTQRPCPALAHPRDWCTAEQPWDPPAWFRSLSNALGLHAAEAPVQFAAQLFGTEPAEPQRERFRVVGLPPAEKGKQRLFVCNELGRQPVVRLDRDAGPANAAMDTAIRGEVLRLSGLSQKGDGLRLSRDGRVEREP